MSLAADAGQLFVIGFPGTEPDSDVESLIRDEGVGGVILFARNLVDPPQVRRLTAHLQSFSSALPLLIATDQEGGIVLRIGSDGAEATPWPGAMSLGAAASADLTRRVGAGIARELRAMGINMNLAPVLDVNVNPSNPVIGVRSFGADPHRVAENGVAYIEGHHEAGVLATAKHFPGHGDTAFDSHLALASVPHAIDRLEAVELIPFRRAIAAGVDAIMTAHVAFPAVEPDPATPATLSPAVLTGLLRQRLGFDGLVITDCMEMKAIADHVGTVEGAVRAIAAPLVPIRPERTLLLAVDPAPVVEVEERGATGSPVLQAAAALAPGLRARGMRRDPTPAEVERLVADAASADLVLVATYLADRFPGQAALVDALRAAGRQVVLIAQRGPYDLLAVPGAQAAVVMYEDRRLPAEAALRFLLGQGGAPGRLPVSLSKGGEGR